MEGVDTVERWEGGGYCGEVGGGWILWRGGGGDITICAQWNNTHTLSLSHAAGVQKIKEQQWRDQV